MKSRLNFSRGTFIYFTINEFLASNLHKNNRQLNQFFYSNSHPHLYECDMTWRRRNFFNFPEIFSSSFFFFQFSWKFLQFSDMKVGFLLLKYIHIQLGSKVLSLINKKKLFSDFAWIFDRFSGHFKILFSFLTGRRMFYVFSMLGK